MATTEHGEERTGVDAVGSWTAPDPDTQDMRDRILNAASRLFYANGIRATGISEIVKLAGITKVTLYRHFASKDLLVLAYLDRRSSFERGYVRDAMALARENPGAAARAIASTIGIESCSPGFRGCPFINAAAEFGDPANIIRQNVDEHRRWFKEAIEDLLRNVGRTDVEATAAELVMLRDGAMISGYLGDSEEVAAALYRAGSAIVAAHGRD